MIFYEPTERRWTSAPASIMPPLTMPEKRIDDAKEFFGLDNLNCHFDLTNADNPISNRVIRALTMYDSGTRAFTDWEALYRYVVSIEIAISTKRNEGRKKLTAKLNSLILYGGHVGVGMKREESLANPEHTAYGRRVELTVMPFEKYYELRNDILHGNEIVNERLSDTDVDEARELAHNTVRLMAEFSRKYEWKDITQLRDWFETGQRIANIIGLTDDHKIVFGDQVESLRAAIRNLNETYPIESGKIVGRLNRLVAYLNKDRLDKNKLAKVTRELDNAGHALSSNSVVTAKISEILAMVDDLPLHCPRPTCEKKVSANLAHSKTN